MLAKSANILIDTGLMMILAGGFVVSDAASGLERILCGILVKGN